MSQFESFIRISSSGYEKRPYWALKRDTQHKYNSLWHSFKVKLPRAVERQRHPFDYYEQHLVWSVNFVISWKQLISRYVCVCFMYLFHFLVPNKLPIHIYNIGQTRENKYFLMLFPLHHRIAAFSRFKSQPLSAILPLVFFSLFPSFAHSVYIITLAQQLAGKQC